MEILTKFKNLIFVSLVSCCFILPMFTSCADIKELWGAVDDINERLDSLESGLNGQIEAMNALLAGGDITIANCRHNDNGSYTITLSNGTKFTVMPESAIAVGHATPTIPALALGSSKKLYISLVCCY